VITFKQLEAVYWIDRLGSFAAAAARLNTTQSAISKRVQELEAAFDIEVFDRSRRRARLSERGEELAGLARRLLEQRDLAVEQLSRPDAIGTRLRLGVTELTAMTWLPRLVRLIQRRYPKIVIEPDVDLSIHLREKVLAGEADLVIVPDVFPDSRLSAMPVGRVENAWMCKPGLIKARRTVEVRELAAHNLLTQGALSGTGIVYDRWLKALGIPATSAVITNHLLAQIGLTVSGLGISYLPRRCLRGLVDEGLLAVVRTRPALPPVTYVAMHRSGRQSRLIASIVTLAQESCDFSRLFRTDADD
jgi:DNA-binding transcriptional LysR family regulator